MITLYVFLNEQVQNSTSIALSLHNLPRSTDLSFLALLPVIAEALLDSIILPLATGSLARHETLLTLLALDRKLSPELYLARTTLGELVCIVLDRRRDELFLVLAGCNWACPFDSVGVL